jgi:hypothetical protein
MKILLILTGVAEAATGVALLAAPALVGRLLLGAELAGVSVVVARVAGIALLALGVGCWPGPASLGMLTYSTLATVYLAHLALGGEWIGPLLWPAVGLHAVLAILLGRAWLMNPKTGGRNTPASEQ